MQQNKSFDISKGWPCMELHTVLLHLNYKDIQMQIGLEIQIREDP